MDDLTPVKGPPTPFEGRSAKVLSLVVIALLVALIKPWGTGPGPTAPAPAGSSGPSGPATSEAVAASPTPFDPFANYDHEIFGIYEPEPRWELWPAGYLVSFGYAIRIESMPSATPGAPVTSPDPSGGPGSPEPSTSGPPSPPAARTPPPKPSGAPSDGEPIWPATIRITRGNNLGLIGVNMPLGYRITGIGVFRTTDGVDEALEIISPASDWPSHFTIIGLADEDRTEAIERWKAGHYRLELTFQPGNIQRTVKIDIDPSPLDEPQPSPSPAPG